MRKTETREIQFHDYQGIVSENIPADAHKSAKKLRGLHAIHVNATPVGGGVAEILKSMVPCVYARRFSPDFDEKF